MSKCIKCNDREILIKKRQLCSKCYGKMRRGDRDSFLPKYASLEANERITHKSEIDFIKNYFTHSNWIYHPVNFRLSDTSYTPDFYDGEKNIFIEVVGSRQAFHNNKEKYKSLNATFPKIKFEVRLSNGELIEDALSDVFKKDWSGISKNTETIK